MNLDYQAGNTPLLARQNMPVATFLITILSIFAVIIVIFFIVRLLQKHFNSEAYKEKQRSRKTKYKDVETLGRIHHLSRDEMKMLWRICQITQCSNILYQIKTSEQIVSVFKEAYQISKDTLSDEKLAAMFYLLFKLESIPVQANEIKSTRGIPVSETIFLASKGDIFIPMTLTENTKNHFSLEIPDYLYNSSQCPKELERLGFSYKAKSGISYNFITRAMRFDRRDLSKVQMLLAHSDNLVAQTQRHYKREFLDSECRFSQITLNKNGDTEEFVFSQKTYNGKLTNISAGGCCIRTSLPIVEKQYLCVMLDELGFDEKIIGIIRKTRKVTDNTFALHIQFLNISQKMRNKIYAFVYKFEL